MARTIQEIKKTMTDRFMADTDLRNAYGITGEDATWENTFSTVSIENMMIYIVSVCAYTLEIMFDTFCQTVDDKIAQAVVASLPWYYKIAKQFQFGDEMVFDEETQSFIYQSIDESKQLVKYVAVKDMGGSIQILASADEGGKPVPLPMDVLTAFKSYLNRCKIAGINLNVRSVAADNIRINCIVEIDPMVLNTSGMKLSDGTYPVIQAINSYLANIKYGGTFNKTKLIDAIQKTQGIMDVTLGICEAKTAADNDFKTIESNNYTAFSGCFIAEGLNNSLSYVV